MKLTTDYEHLGTTECIAVSYKALPKTVKVGSTIYAADGNLTLEVTEIGSDFVMVNCKNGIKLGEKKK